MFGRFVWCIVSLWLVLFGLQLTMIVYHEYALLSAYLDDLRSTFHTLVEIKIEHKVFTRLGDLELLLEESADREGDHAARLESMVFFK